MSKRFQGGILGAGFDPLKAPNAPTGVTAAKGNQSATVSFTAPTNVGGSAITGYAVLSNPGGFGASGASSPVTVSGLTNGTPYTFTVTALNSYGPSPAGGPSSSVTPSENYWIGLLGGSNTQQGFAVTNDTAGNVYFCGLYTLAGSAGVILAKYDAAGAIQWQRGLGYSDDTGYSVAVDASGNVYVCGKSKLGGSDEGMIVCKYNASGTLQWQRYLGLGGTFTYGYSVALDSTGNPHVGGYVSDTTTGYAYMVVAKYDASGTIQWQRRLNLTSTVNVCRSIAVDSSNNVYLCGYSDSSGVYRIQIAKYDASGTIQWQRSLGSSSPATTGFGIDVDGSGNAYVCGGGPGGILAKYNTSGTIQWQRKLGGNSDAFNSVSVDSNGNAYVVGYSTVSSNTDVLIAKYDTSGAIQWQRKLGTSGYDEGNSVHVGTDGNLYVCGRSGVSGSDDFIIAKLPGDGSLAGTYTVGAYSFTYAVSSLTDAAGTLTSSTTSLTSSTSSASTAASSLPSVTTTLTSSVTQI